MGFFNKIKDAFVEKEEDPLPQEGEGEYVELEHDTKDSKSKITVRPFVISDFEDVKEILDSLREGYTIALVNIRPLKDKDLVVFYIRGFHLLPAVHLSYGTAFSLVLLEAIFFLPF